MPWVQPWGTAAAKAPPVYADQLIPDDEQKRAAETDEDAQAIPFLKRFTVFNTDQCNGLPDEIATVAPPPMPGMIEPRVEALIKATSIDFRSGGSRAFYRSGKRLCAGSAAGDLFRAD